MEALPSMPRRTRARWYWLGAIVLVLATTVGVFVARRPGDASAAAKSAPAAKKKDGKKGDQAAPTAAPVELSAVRSGEISTWLQTTATLEPRNTATLIAKRGGQVVEVATEEGAWVAKGQPLARLDSRDETLAVERAEVALDMSKRELERGRQLGGKGYLSTRELDDLELKTRTARIELDRMRLELADTRIVAPFSGRVTDRLVQLGETVSPGRECFRIADFNPVLARLYFPERELARVRLGQTAWLSTDAQPGASIEGKVTLVNPMVDRSNGTFKVTLEIPNPRGALPPGTFARVRLKTGATASALLVPRRGVLNEDGESYVFVARGDSVQRVAVKLGAVEGETAQVVAGLAVGDRVVTVGQGGLKPGSRIKPVTL